MQETRVKVTIEVNDEEKKVVEGTSAVVMMYTEEEEGMKTNEYAYNVDPVLAAVYLYNVRNKELKPGVSLMHDVMEILRRYDKEENSLLGKIRRFFTKP